MRGVCLSTPLPCARICTVPPCKPSATCTGVHVFDRVSSASKVICRATEESAPEPTRLQEVDAVISARLVFDTEGKPSVEYLARWKEDAAMTWEPTENLSEDLVRDFEEGFWMAVKQGKLEQLEAALQHGGEVVANIVDENARSPLHFAAALNNTQLMKKLLDAGAHVDEQDQDGYTPLHMAAGYLHNESVNALLEAGADVSLRDKTSRDVFTLVDGLREKMTSAAAVQQRVRLEEVSKALLYHEYEDVVPAAVLAKRQVDDGVQFLVQWRDGSDDSWVSEDNLSDEIKADFEAGLEYAEAEVLLDVRGRGDAKEYLVRWSDDHPESWESEDNLARPLISDFEKRRRQERKAKKAHKAQSAAGVEAQTAAAPDKVTASV